MDKRDRFIVEIRDEARALGLAFRVDYRKGKGGHAMVYVGDKLVAEPRNRSQDGAKDQKTTGVGRLESANVPNQKERMMRSFTYAAEFERGDKRGIVVSFPDVPEAITQGDDMADARAQAEEALGLALLTYPERGLPLPKARAKGKGLTMVAVAPAQSLCHR